MARRFRRALKRAMSSRLECLESGMSLRLAETIVSLLGYPIIGDRFGIRFVAEPLAERFASSASDVNFIFVVSMSILSSRILRKE